MYAESRLAWGVDVDRALLTSRLVVLDVRETLDEFMVAGRPDPARFRAAITAIMDRAGAGWRSLRVSYPPAGLLVGRHVKPVTGSDSSRTAD